MNFLVFLNTDAGELEKTLSGVKSMVLKEVETENTASSHVKRGDNLYFLRNNEECDLQVKAVVKSIRIISSGSAADLAQSLKEFQPRLQLTEEQYRWWSAKRQVQLVELEAAQKIGVIHLSLDDLKAHSNWIAFEAFSILTSGMFQ